MLSRSEGINQHLHASTALTEPRRARPPVPGPVPGPVPEARSTGGGTTVAGLPRPSASERLGAVGLVALAVFLPWQLALAVRPVALAAVIAGLLGAGLLLALFVPAVAGRVLAPPGERATAAGGPRSTAVVIRVARFLGDVGAILLSIAVASTLTETPASSSAQLALFTTASAVGWIAAFAALGLYDPRKLVGGSEELKLIIQAVLSGTVLTVLAAFVLAVPTPRSWVLITCAAGLITVAGTRLAYRRVLRALRLSGALSTRLLIVGAGREARDLWRTITGKGAYLGFQVVGLVDDAPPEDTWPGSPPVLGSAKDIRELAIANGVQAILVAGGSVTTDTAEQVYRDLQGLPVDLHLSTGLLGIATSRVAVQRFVDIPVLGLRRVELTGPQQAVKRAADVITAALALTLLSPVLLAVAVAVRLSGPGPILFRQRRVGQDGREFTLHKFRSMVTDAERRLGALSASNESDGLLFKMRDDPRTTKVGKLLRRWSLDELPQLLDVLRGDMSIVGPRPPLPSEVARYDEWLRNRLRVKPGITGLWQVSGRHTLSFEDYVRYDLFYVENWSLALDLFISLRTIPAVLGRSGA